MIIQFVFEVPFLWGSLTGRDLREHSFARETTHSTRACIDSVRGGRGLGIAGGPRLK